MKLIAKKIIPYLSIVLIFLFGSLSEDLLAQLPQDHAYQITLRDYLGTFEESDFEVNLSELELDESYFSSLDEAYQAWLFFGYQQYHMPATEGLRVGASHFTLAAIEEGNRVNMTVGKNQFLPLVATAFYADWDYPGNPHYNSNAVKLRAFVGAAVDIIMQDQDHENGNYKRSDFLGQQLVRWAFAYKVVKDILPQDVRSAFEVALIKMFEKLEEWGPTGIHADMDIPAIVGMLYTAESVDSQDLTQRAHDHTNLILDKHLFDAGYVDHGSGYDVGYNGISLFFMNWAAQISDYPPVVEAVQKMAELKAYTTLPDPDGEEFRSYHTNPSSGAIDLWGPHHRDAGVSHYSDEAVHSVVEELGDLPTMLEDMDNSLRYFHSDEDESHGAFISPSNESPGEWGPTHWIAGEPFNATAYHYKEGLYDKLLNFKDVNSPYTKLPFLRDESFVESFADKIISVKNQNYGTVIFNDRLSWWTGEGETQVLNGFGGGNLSAFWTPQTGTVLFGASRGTHDTGHSLDEWREWPVHALSGETSSGSAFSSGLQRYPEAVYELNQTQPMVTITGDLADIYADPTDGLIGEAEYQRVFVMEEDGIRVTTSVSIDSSNSVDRLYEILPVFRRDASRQSSENPTTIEFEVNESWQPADTTPQTVSRIRLQRFGGEVIIEFNESVRAKLSPQEFYRDPDGQNGSQMRNIMISLLDNNGEPASEFETSVGYKIYNPNMSNDDSGDDDPRDDEPDEEVESPQLNQNYPNPFNPETTISYQLPEASQISIQIFDMTGRLVATLLDGNAQAGLNSLTFDAENLSSGIYYYRLVTDQAAITKKMTLIK